MIRAPLARRATRRAAGPPFAAPSSPPPVDFTCCRRKSTRCVSRCLGLVAGSRWLSTAPVASWNVSSPSSAPFRSRPFRLMWGGALVSNIGTWMETVALGYYVADSTGKASWSAVVAAAGFLPGAIIGPVGSAMAARLRRRRVLATGSVLSGLIAAGLAVWVGTGGATPLGIALVAFLAGCVSAFTFPSFQTTLPTLVPRDQLVAAVGLSNAQWNIGRV
ncbi:MAG: MFS transporter, partial [Ilumatobacteraceae bacterium]